MRKCLLIFVIALMYLWSVLPGFSQEAKIPGEGYFLVEARVFYGSVYAHHKQLEYLHSRFPSYEISLARQTSGLHEWERCYKQPIIGISFFYSNLGNSPILRQVYSVMPFINFPLAKSDNFTAGFRLSTGIAYFPHPYDPVENPLNIAICTHLNAAINLMFEARYKLSRQFALTGSLSFQHFSNGGWKEPNYGLNIPLFSIGMAYRPFPADTGKKVSVSKLALPPVHVDLRRIEINTGVGFGYKNRMEEYGQNYVIYHVYENTYFPVSRKSMFGFGFDLSYDPSQEKAFEAKGITVNDHYHYMMTGINAAYALVISKLEILMNFGIYPGRTRPDGPVYEKLALQYNFSHHFFGQVMLKAHLTAADYIAFSAGYRFDLKYGKKKVR